MKRFIQTAYRDYPIASGLVTITAGFIGFRMIRKALQPKPDVPQVPPIPLPGSVPNPNSKYTYGAQQYSDWAQLLFDAMDGMGTNENAIRNVLKNMRTYEDVLALIDAYGRRSLTYEIDFIGIFSTKPMTLAQSFKDELSDADIAIYVNDPIKRTGYKFA